MKSFLRNSWGFASVLVLSGAMSAQADVRYTTLMTMGGAADTAAEPDPTAGAGMPGIRTTTFVKDMHERVETSVQMGPIKMDTVTLTLCDKHQSVKLDTGLKIYTVGDIGALSIGSPDTARPGMKMPEGKPGKGSVITTLTTQDLGMEKVAGHQAHHLKLKMRNQTDGCIGKADTTFVMEEWVAPLKGALVCPERLAPSRTITNENGCSITYSFKGDLDTMKAIGSGMVVRMIMYSDPEGTKKAAEQDLRDYSTAPLDDSLFVVPADYKQVSGDEFQKQQADAMRKNMFKGFGDSFKPPVDDNAGQNTEQALPQGDTPAVPDNPADQVPQEIKKKLKIKLPHFPF